MSFMNININIEANVHFLSSKMLKTESLSFYQPGLPDGPS